MPYHKPIAIMLADKDGMYTKYCKDKKTAIKLMNEELADWASIEHYKDQLAKVVINEETVGEGRYRQHKVCETETITRSDNADDMCYECFEPCGTVGRKCFTIWF